MDPIVYMNENLKKLRDNYIETLKKLIAIEEEIERTVFYIQSLDQKEREKVFELYQEYLKNLEILRKDMTHLMQDNLLTAQTLMKTINQENNQSAMRILSESYKNFVDFIWEYYNPFKWVSKEQEKK